MIKAEGIHKTFEDFTALDNITCSISDGCIYGMVGSNGAGKSTFLRVLSGIYKPDKGCAYIDNAPIYENPKFTFIIVSHFQAIYAFLLGVLLPFCISPVQLFLGLMNRFRDGIAHQ